MRKLVTQRTISVCSILSGRNRKLSLAVVNKNLAVTRKVQALCHAVSSCVERR
jgi:hypothetical protein